MENRATLRKEYEFRSKTIAEKDKAFIREESLVSEAVTLRKCIEELKLKNIRVGHIFRKMRRNVSFFVGELLHRRHYDS